MEALDELRIEDAPASDVAKLIALFNDTVQSHNNVLSDTQANKASWDATAQRLRCWCGFVARRR